MKNSTKILAVWLALCVFAVNGVYANPGKCATAGRSTLSAAISESVSDDAAAQAKAAGIFLEELRNDITYIETSLQEGIFSWYIGKDFETDPYSSISQILRNLPSRLEKITDLAVIKNAIQVLISKVDLIPYSIESARPYPNPIYEKFHNCMYEIAKDLYERKMRLKLSKSSISILKKSMTIKDIPIPYNDNEPASMKVLRTWSTLLYVLQDTEKGDKLIERIKMLVDELLEATEIESIQVLRTEIDNLLYSLAITQRSKIETYIREKISVNTLLPIVTQKQGVFVGRDSIYRVARAATILTLFKDSRIAYAIGKTDLVSPPTNAAVNYLAQYGVYSVYSKKPKKSAAVFNLFAVPGHQLTTTPRFLIAA